MAIFVTSNLQLGRPNAIKTYKRDFENVDDMDTHLINQWNSVVKASDTVYHLGNFAWDPKTAQNSLLRLNGTIKIVLGEHEAAIRSLESKGMLRAGVSIVECIQLEEDSVLSYWPLATWPNKAKKHFSVIGYPGKKFKSDPKTRVINVSTDLWNNIPQELDRIISIFKDI